MPDRHRLDLAHQVLPGFGAFGREPPLHWTLPVGGELRRITLFLDQPGPQSYSFPGIHLIGMNGEAIGKEAAVETIEASSLHERHAAHDPRALFLAGKTIRSGVVVRPALDVVLRPGLTLSEIRLANHGGLMGRASRNLALRGYHGGRLVLAVGNGDPQRIVQAHRALCARLQLPFPVTPLSRDQREGHVRQIRAAVLARLEAAEPGLDPLTLIHLLPAFRHEGALTPFQRRLAAEILVAAVLARQDLSARTRGFFPLSALMSTAGNIEAIVTEGNRLLSQRLGRPVAVVAGKHEFHESRLLQNRDRFLRGLDLAFPALRDCGVTPMLCYGSLLGAVREGAFIPHDDDVDILYHDGARSREEMLANLRHLLEALGRAGYHVHLADNLCHALVHKGNGVLDLFPCWEEGDNIQVLMRSDNYQPVPRSVLLPTGEVVLHGHRYPAPADPAAFLAARYGDGWTTPDPYHEWPWPVRRKAEGNAAEPAPGSGLRNRLAQAGRNLLTR